jgi:hypothetical protein
MLGKSLTALSTALLTLSVPSGTAHTEVTGPWGVPSGRTTAPPWPAPKSAITGIKAAGLPLMTESVKLAQHIHVHLDVLVDGKPVEVPGDIGIDHQNHGLSPLHTHDDSGLLHIESATLKDFYLGQLFNEWQVSLSRHNIGGLRTGINHVLEVHVNGKLYQGDPRALKLGAHDEIAVVYGKVGSRVDIPDRYQFPLGT